MPKLMFDILLEVMTEFKYLGLVFKSTGSFNNCKVHLKEQAAKAMFALLSKRRVLNMDAMLELFDVGHYDCSLSSIDDVFLYQT